MREYIRSKREKTYLPGREEKDSESERLALGIEKLVRYWHTLFTTKSATYDLSSEKHGWYTRLQMQYCQRDW